jgi:hypothetical protein
VEQVVVCAADLGHITPRYFRVGVPPNDTSKAPLIADLVDDSAWVVAVEPNVAELLLHNENEGEEPSVVDALVAIS